MGCLHLVSAVVGAALAATAQAPLGPPVTIRADVATASPADGTPARTRLDLGLAVLRDGQHDAAVRSLLAALELHPASPTILRALLKASSEDPDARVLWGLALALATCDERGRPQLARADKNLLLQKGDVSRKVATAQAAAIAELARWVGRLRVRDPGDGVLARWAADLALDLGRDAPLVLTAHSTALTEAVDTPRPDFETIFAALRRLLGARPVGTATEGDDLEAARTVAIDRAIRAARIFRALSAHVGFDDDLRGPPPPDLGDLPREARDALMRLRARVIERAGEPWTLERLRALTADERLAFTERHSTWADPAVAVSPRGLYAIHTTCGFETVFGVVSTIEDHHRRLVNWFGGDPFAQRRGTVRIEPEHDGLEANGTPFWWAGGFQSGDLTVLRFAWDTIDGLGRGLTHELTHRFDGTFYPSMPTWLLEGRAVWTGRSYGKIPDREFAEDFLSPGAVQRPFVRGYGSLRKFTQLLEGTIDDFRDNYTAGYALYTYLKTWRGPDGRPLFAEPLLRFMENARDGRADPVAFFVAHFADGEAGRPDGLEEFTAGFAEFMRQCYRWSWGKDDRDEQNAWIGENYRLGLTGAKTWRSTVMDVPTLSWARNRAEPWFGQEHALAAGRLLGEVGDAKAAVAAFCWSLQVDGWRAENAAACAAWLDTVGARDAAWAVRCEASRRLTQVPGPTGEAPMLARLPKVRALLGSLRAAAEAQRDAERPLAAAGLAERHDRLAAAVGAALLDFEPARVTTSRYPRIQNPHGLGTLGWTEDGLTGFEERRREGLWFETEQGDIHVGRERPRDATGLKDRAAHQRHAFVRSVEWQAPGRYVIRARVHFTTSFASGALVFGRTRRDRYLRFNFRAGDFLYSIGRKDQDAKTKVVHFSLDALWQRDRQLPGARPPGKHEFAQPSSYVDLEVRVDGASAECFAMGERLFSYTTPDLSPIEGSVGFAMGQGAVRVQTPTVQRLDRGALIDPTDPQRDILSMVQRPLAGVPRAESGTLVLWLPRDPDVEYLVDETGRTLRRLARQVRQRRIRPQPWVVMAPADLPGDARADLEHIVEQMLPAGTRIVPHVRAEPPEQEPWVLFVDAEGVLRAAGSAEIALPGSVQTWARRYRPPVR